MVTMIALSLFAAAPAAAENFDARLEKIVAGAAGAELAAASLAVSVDGEIVYKGAAGCAQFDEAGEKCRRKMKPETKMRVASISKMVAASAALALADEGLLDLDRDISDYLGWPLRNPHFPDAPITARQLMAHTSSLRDPEEYWVAAPGGFHDLLENSPGLYAEPKDGASRAPGGYFAYANINYGVLAGVMERAAKARFDVIVADRVLAPAGLNAGFNWSGVSTGARKRAAALYRMENGKWAAQVDGPAMRDAEGPYFLHADDVDPDRYLALYDPGYNPTLFSPQGGLRASVLDLVTLTEKRERAEPLWTYDPAAANGDTEDDFFAAFGLGVQTTPGGALLPEGQSFVGHSGEAYGLHAGAWRVEGGERDVVFAFSITGAAAPLPASEHPTFNAAEAALVKLALEAAGGAQASHSGHKGHHDDGNPRPFDETRAAMSDVDAALAAARARGTRALLVLGGNWCHDSRGLAAKFEDEALASLIAEQYELVWVDVGMRDRNLDVAQRFGVPVLFGTPTILIVSADGALLNEESVHDWRNADSRTMQETVDYLKRFVD